MVKVGDKIKVVATEWTSIPNGSIMTVTDDPGYGHVNASINGGDGFSWPMTHGTYELCEPLKIEAGKYYKTRDGRKVGPMYVINDPYWPWACSDFSYRDDGTWDADMEQDEQDLIEEWQDEPASDVTPEPTEIDTLAALAKKHGICITVITGEVSIKYDGRTNPERST